MQMIQAIHAIQAILSDMDLGALLLQRLTVQEAGRLGGACRTARILVRRGEAALHAGDLGAVLRGPAARGPAALTATFLPMWNTEHVLARLQRYRQPFFAAGGLQFRETTTLARLLLDELLPAGVIELHFLGYLIN
jgi:hypothetical protein